MAFLNLEPTVFWNLSLVFSVLCRNVSKGCWRVFCVTYSSNMLLVFTWDYYSFGVQKESEKKEVVAGIHEGSLSIVIGTHALLGSQIRYQNLGLLVVDEEQVRSLVQSAKMCMVCWCSFLLYSYKCLQWTL